jgi:hypothetical protein
MVTWPSFQGQVGVRKRKRNVFLKGRRRRKIDTIFHSTKSFEYKKLDCKDGYIITSFSSFYVPGAVVEREKINLGQSKFDNFFLSSILFAIHFSSC